MADTESESVRTEAEGRCPPLPKSGFVRTYTLRKGSQQGQGWGLVLKGTTCELEGNLKVYTCQVEDVTNGGEAQVNLNLRH